MARGQARLTGRPGHGELPALVVIRVRQNAKPSTSAVTAWTFNGPSRLRWAFFMHSTRMRAHASGFTLKHGNPLAG